MTYSEAYQKAETPQELIDAVIHDVSVWALYGRNPDRLKAITTAMNKTAKDKNWDLVRITKCVEMRTGEALLSAIGTGCYRCAYNNGECDSGYGEGCIAGNLEWLKQEVETDDER